MFYVNSLNTEFDDFLKSQPLDLSLKNINAQAPWIFIIGLIVSTIWFLIKLWMSLFVDCIEHAVTSYKNGVSFNKVFVDFTMDFAALMRRIIYDIWDYISFYFNGVNKIYSFEYQLFSASVSYFLILMLLVFIGVSFWGFSRLRLARNKLIFIISLFILLISLPLSKVCFIFFKSLIYFLQNDISALHYLYTISGINTFFLYSIFTSLRRYNVLKRKNYDSLNATSCPYINFIFTIFLLYFTLVVLITFIGWCVEIHNCTNAISNYVYTKLNENWYNAWATFNLQSLKATLLFKVYFLFLCNLYFLYQIWFLFYYTFFKKPLSVSQQ